MCIRDSPRTCLEKSYAGKFVATTDSSSLAGSCARPQAEKQAVSAKHASSRERIRFKRITPPYQFILL